MIVDVSKKILIVGLGLLEQMDQFMGKFKSLRTMLETEDIDGMREMMRHSTKRRELFDK